MPHPSSPIPRRRFRGLRQDEPLVDAQPQLAGGRLASVALDDPVPAAAMTTPTEPEVPLTAPHQVERDVLRVLEGAPELRFESLTVRRMPDGVCLQGVVRSNDRIDRIDSLARSVAGVDRVINQIVQCQNGAVGR